ncbi:MAG: OmpH family outer membrane protein [Nitrospira sp.]
MPIESLGSADVHPHRCGGSSAYPGRDQRRETGEGHVGLICQEPAGPDRAGRKELRRMEEDFVKQGSVLSATAKREREEQFRRRMAEYQQKVTDLNREVQDKQKEVLDGFRDKIESLSAKVAKRLELQAIFDRGRGGPTLYFDEAVDVSSQLIEEFNKTYP